MKKLPGQSGLVKYIATAIGNANRKKIETKASSELINLFKKINQQELISMEVASFSSFKDYPEQLLSILSFVRYVGIPINWTIYSDGSHSPEQIAHLEKTFSFLKVVKGLNWNEIQSLRGLCKKELEPYEENLLDFAKKTPYGKKLFYYINHNIENPTLFIDSDILFYEKATVLKLLLTEKPKSNGYFLADSFWGCLDSRYQAVYSEQIYQVNSGFIYANAPFQQLEDSLEFFKIYNFTYEYFSEQTFYHHLLKNNNYMPLPSKTFILDSGDQFDFSYLNKPDQIAIRHYTGPVRHKMWQKNYKWHLGL